MSEPNERKLTSTQILSIIGLGFGLLVFAGGLMIGVTIDPRVDLQSRLLAYTLALGGLAAGLACRWALATLPIERKIFAAITLASLSFFLGYAFVML